MPTYEYRCNDCGHELEAFQKITEPPLKLCPQCNKEALERLISGGNFVLKGGGWYKDLYGSPARKPTTDGQQADKMDTAHKTSEADSKNKGKPAA